MRKRLFILLVVLALLVVPVAAEERNWKYNITSSLQTVDSIAFGCNLFATDYVDTGYDLIAPPNPPSGPNGYAYLRIYQLPGIYCTTQFVQALNEPMSPSNDETVFTLKFKADDTSDASLQIPFTLTWNPVADANLPATITGITLVNLSDTSETYDMMSAGTATGTAYADFMGTIVSIPRTYSINVTYDLPVPVADFSGTPTTIAEGASVTFTDASTPAGLIDSWAWNFGDTGTSTDQNATHVYATQGTYTVTLTATNDAGSNAEVKTGYITVTGPPPVANFTYSPASPQAGDTVNFQDTSTESPATWLWDFGDGTAPSTVQDPTHVYAVAGAYTVNLTATNNGGSDSFQDTVTVAVQNAPTAEFSGLPLTGVAPLNVAFTDASTGYNITDWSWDFGDSGTSTAEDPSHIYTLEGVYNVNLTVTNDGGSDSEIKTAYITVTGLPPAASFTTNVTSGTAPLTVDFTDTSVAYSGANIASWAWDFGAGEGTSTLQSPVHTYASPGNYNVTLTVTDDATTPASNTSAPTLISVSGPAPVADFSGTPTLVSVMNGLVTFTDLSTSADFNIVSWGYIFGDGGTSQSVQDPTHTYTTAGNYTVTLTAGDDQVPPKVNVSTKVDYIEVVDAPTADFTWPGMVPVEGISPVTVTYTDASAADGSAVINGWAWDFGAAGISPVQAPVPISFTTPGWYDVSLNVTDSAGGYDVETKERIVHVYNVSPVASFTASPLTGDAPLAVLFAVTSSGGPIETYAWDFGDGGISSAQMPTYTYTTPGIWNANLTVTNDGGSYTYGPVSINVTQPPVPIPDFTATPVSGYSPVTVQFTENISGAYTDVLWEFEDSGTVFRSTDLNPQYTFHLLGTHNVSLTAWNALGNMTTTKVDYIRVALPLSSGDSGDISGEATPVPTTVPTSTPGGVTPTATAVPTGQPSGTPTPAETVTPVPTATPTGTATGTTGDTGGFPWIYAVIGLVIVVIVVGYFMMNKKE